MDGKVRKLAAFMGLAVTAAVLSVPHPAHAEEQGYSYKVRIYAGSQGSIRGTDCIEYEMEPGEQFVFDPEMVSVSNDKYYVMGIKESGKDNSLSASVFTVTRDQDYVVAYGLSKDKVAFSVNYMDTAGNKLLPSATYYGNVGDKPVVGYRYVSGYRPQAYNVTKTLSANAEENVFTIYYDRLAEGEEDGAGSAAAAQGEAAGTQAVDETSVGTDATTNAANLTELEDEQTPTNILDLDKDGVVFSDFATMIFPRLAELPPVLKVILGAMFGLAGVFLLWTVLIIIPRKREEKERRRHIGVQ